MVITYEPNPPNKQWMNTPERCAPLHIKVILNVQKIPLWSFRRYHPVISRAHKLIWRQNKSSAKLLGVFFTLSEIRTISLLYSKQIQQQQATLIKKILFRTIISTTKEVIFMYSATPCETERCLGIAYYYYFATDN